MKGSTRSRVASMHRTFVVATQPLVSVSTMAATLASIPCWPRRPLAQAPTISRREASYGTRAQWYDLDRWLDH